MTTYTYQTIDPPGSTYTIANSIDSNGQIVGLYYDSNRVEHGFLDNNGIYTTIDPPGSVETDATDINSGGQIVGVYQIAGGVGGTLGFLDSKGTYTTIAPPGSINGNLYTNKAGQIVGTYRDSNGVDHGFLYSHGAYTTLNFPDAIDPEAIDTYALSINDVGQVVGAYLDNNGRGGALHGFLFSHGTYTAIEPPGAFDSVITSINKFGTIVGWYQTSSGGPEQGFMYSHGTYTTIDFPGAISTVPRSINDKGQITGYYGIGSPTGIPTGITADYSFVYSNGQYTTIDPPGSTSPIAYSINNSGQVVGEYFANNTNHGFVATDPPQATQTIASSPTDSASAVKHGVAMFAGTDAAGDRGLWVTDGTAAGTYELTGISSTYSGGLFGGNVNPDFTEFNNKVLFSGLDAADNGGLWVTDGTVGGTYELTNIPNANAGGLFIGYFPAFTVLNGQVLFNGIDAAGDAGLWLTDGTAAGTHELTGISGANAGGLFHGWNPVFTVFNGEVLFTGLDAANNFGLWVTDGTSAGTHELTGISGAHPGPAGGLFGGEAVVSPADFTVFNGEVLFNGIDAAGLSGLWVTNGTAAGTNELTGINGANAGPPTGATPPGLDPKDLTVFGHEALFNGVNASAVDGLWVTDGTAAGTHELTGVTGVAANGLDPTDLTVFKNKVLFAGTDATGDTGLWVTNGTAAGTHELTVKGAYSGGLQPYWFTVINNEVVFRGLNASGQSGLWVTNGTSAGTRELTGISDANASGLNVNDLTAVTLQLVQAMASFSPTGSALTVSPLNQTTDNLMQLSNHLAQPH